MRCRCVSRSSALLSVLVLLMCCFSPSTVVAEGADALSAPEERLQAIVSVLKSRLEIASPVVVSIVPSNALMMSVEPASDTGESFVLSVEASFLVTLTDDELEAALAHELGHVWIFTHHPFLQTEELANRIAMRAVKRESLERVYAKVWKRSGTKGDPAWFFGSAPTASAAGLASESSR